MALSFPFSGRRMVYEEAPPCDPGTMARALYVDPSIAGISGNMLLGALVDLGARLDPLEELAKVVSRQHECWVKVRREKVHRYGFGALWLDWEIDEKREDIPGVVFLERVKAAGEATGWSPEARAFAVEAATTLVEAEAAVHHQKLEEVVFHELGSHDTVLDVVGVALLLQDLALLDPGVEVWSAPVTVGRGNLEVRHGHMSVPPFVTAELLRRHAIPFRFSHLEGEFATPTGVALLAPLVDHWSQGLTLLPSAMGHGAGLRELEGIPNVLRLTLGEAPGPGDAVNPEWISVVETTLDDAPGEVIGYALERLMAEGALDVQVIPTVGKKNRPGHIIQVLVSPGLEEKVADILMRETGTLGVRVASMRKRSVLGRDTLSVEFKAPGVKAKVRVKVSRDPSGNVVRLKPEYEDCREIAERTGLPLRRVMREAEKEAEALLQRGQGGP